MGWGLRVSISNKLLGNTNTDGLPTTLSVARVLKLRCTLKYLGEA